MNNIKDKNSDRLYPKKSLGQNFLRSREALDQIIEAGKLVLGGNVLEIGPGEGVLTSKLLESGQKVIAIEKDESLAAVLEEQFQSHIREGRLGIVAGDVLEMNIPKLVSEFQSYKVIANIPYYITGKILRIFFDTEIRPEMMVLLVQKEVAERICAEPGKMSILGVVANIFGKPEFVAEVGKENFFPEPKVDSAIIRIVEIKKNFSEKDKKAIRLAKIGFSRPRKTLENNLAAGFNMNKEDVLDLLKKAGINSKKRPQELTVANWQELAEIFR